MAGKVVSRNGRSLRSSLGISWPWFQVVLAGVAIAVSMILWLLRNDPDVARVLVFTFVTGNVTVFGLGLSSPLFDQPFPRNWIVYLALLLPIGAAGSLAASLILYFSYPPSDQDVGAWFLSNGSFATLIAFLTGISTYAVQSTRSRLEAEKEQLRREVYKGLKRVQAQESQLQAAFEIQANLLSKTIPQIAGVQISCAWQPAQVVSGDHFDVIPLSDKRIGVCLADVAGKGISAAMLMANLQAAFRAFVADASGPGALCDKLNRTLCAIAAAGKFVTFFYGVIDCEQMTLRYENAGHLPPLLLRNGSPQQLTEGGTVLGLFPNTEYQDRVVSLYPGDCLILTTDGVTEASDSSDDEFGQSRVASAALGALPRGVHAIRIKILEEVTAFCKGDFHDDASLMAVVVQP
jgi:sigma-B regulation protein RsbU (phosphoserine phosphatase)